MFQSNLSIKQSEKCLKCLEIKADTATIDKVEADRKRFTYAICLQLIIGYVKTSSLLWI